MIAGDVFGEKPGDGDDGGDEGLVGELGGGRAVDVGFQAEQHGRKVEGVTDHADEELLPLQAKIGVGAARKTKDLGLLFAGEHGNAAGAFDLVLPPADEAVVLLREWLRRARARTARRSWRRGGRHNARH